MRTAEEKKNTGIYIALILALAAGVTAGSAYLADGWGDMGGEISGYLSRFFSAFSESRNNMAVFRTSLTSNLITLAVIFVMGFFRFGFLGTGAVIIRKGFITGFASASFLRAYGSRGIFIMLSTMPASLILIPALLIYSAVSVVFSAKKNKFQKKIIFSYIFFTIFMISIFCAASFAEGYLTTTFIKWFSLKIN